MRVLYALLPIVPLLAACGGLKSKPETVTSTDGNSQVTMPAGWSKRTDLNDQAELQIGNDFEQCYLVVLTEAKADFDNFTCARYGETIRDNFSSSLKNRRAGPAKTLTINGMQAVQYEVHGTVESMNLGYLITAVEGRKHFYQVLAWTSKSKFASKRSLLDSTIHSFREASK